MAVALSIGSRVSFFYHIPLQQQAAASPLVHLTTENQYAVKHCDTALLLHSNQPLNLAETGAFTADTASGAAVVRLFGAALDWQVVSAVLQRISPEHAVTCRIYRPHPQLAGAVELLLAQPLSLELQQQLAEWPAAPGVELVYLPQRPVLAKPGVLVMDMDSTAIQIECIDEIAKLAGVGEQVAAVTARAMNGELDFAQSLIARVAALRGAPQAILRQVLDALPLMPGLTELVSHLKTQQWQVAIASGGFTYFTDALKQQLGLTATFANVLEIVDGNLTGKVSGEIVDANTKAQVVNRLATEYGIAALQTVAIGDGANDIPMLQAAALGVAFHAKPRVQAQAKAAIRQGSLLQLLYLLD
ncbi:phosphoserine phosphatase SerB [Rheinheimera sp. YQF-2]|uniref:Phosphoserine phosphatase n=1 Tax=Rheinheimera lutimaris TaxID=2740584 RepID=A0A7Y5AU15_9GAMM|nr:phosphoserine phosphatase SerB [Rheinheimera lutimaris]NRQ44530.1 phosphoserine phosphatase SerB [Rheinheimera lutimaris]